MINKLLIDITKYLQAYLSSILPSLSVDWWEYCVIRELTFQQQSIVRTHSITGLANLDLAALLRVFHRNWSSISFKLGLKKEVLVLITEMQNIRNKYAHNTGFDINSDDLYRDLDTLERFSKLLGVEESFWSQINIEKKNLQATSNQLEVAQAKSVSQIIQTKLYEFANGDVVRMRANPIKHGAVIETLPGKPENRFKVFIDGEIKLFYASQLETAVIDEKKQDILPLDLFNAHISALQLRHPGLSTLYSFNSAYVDFIPYQYRPALKLMKADQPRLLIADEVGVGKTIEAAIILRELQARRTIDSVLVLCPKPMVAERKWQSELKRFNEDFDHLDGQTLRYCLDETDKDGKWPSKYSKVIMPFSLFNERLIFGAENNKRIKGLLNLDPPPRFDLVIVDEAHRVRNSDTDVHRGVRFFCDHADAVLFLTATPIQLGSNDLFTLLNILRPDMIIDQNSFESIIEPNEFINKAIDIIRAVAENWQQLAQEFLLTAAQTEWGKAHLSLMPEFQKIYDLLREKKLSNEERVRCIYELEHLHTLAHLINRTRRRDIGEFTMRKAETVSVDFTPAQKSLHDLVLLTQERLFKQIHGDQYINFMMSTIRRQAASCLYGLAPLLKDMLSNKLKDIEWLIDNDLTDDEITSEQETLNHLNDDINILIHEAERIDKNDPKLEALVEIINGKMNLENNKLLVFSSFLHTLFYICSHLSTTKIRYGLIIGKTPDEERRNLRERFGMPKSNPEAIDVLFSSEVGAEGLDYQFCDAIVNYDLPWNPMRIEQRIGRIDRYGQKSPKVVIYNLITPGTIDYDIYDRCLMRIGIFERAIGGNEEILGEIKTELRAIAENLSLTDVERRKRLDQLADNKIRLIQEQDRLEKQSADLFSVNMPKRLLEEQIEDATSYWLTPTALKNLIENYLQKRCGETPEYILGDKQLKTLRLNQDDRNLLLIDYKVLRSSNSPINRQWEQWLKGNNQHFSISFEVNTLTNSSNCTLISPIHPLAQQASRLFEKDQPVLTVFNVSTHTLPKGEYPFALYQWQKQGIQLDAIFQPVSREREINNHFVELLKKANKVEKYMIPDMSIFESLETEHYLLWSKALREHKNDTWQIVEYKKQSLTKSFTAQIGIYEKQLEGSTSINIRRMKTAQIDNARADYHRRTSDLERSGQMADILATPIAFGVIIIGN